MKKLTALLIGLLIGIVVNLNAPEKQLIRVVNRSLKKTVMLTVTYKKLDAKLKVTGAGVIVTKDGYILTAKHLFTVDKRDDLLIREKAITVELSNESVIAGELVALSPKSDLALIKTWMIKDSPYAKIEDPRKLKVGQSVVAIGNPMGLPFTVTTGIISALYRDVDIHYNVTQSDVALNPGNSGGPLFGLNGKLIGINSFIASPMPFFPVFTGLGFSVQSGQCYEFLVLCAKSEKELRGIKWI